MARSRGCFAGWLVLVAAVATLLWTPFGAFIPGGPPGCRRSSSSSPASTTAAIQAPLSVAAVAGLAPLVAGPEASVAQGWENVVIFPLGLVNTGLNLFKAALGIYALMSWLFAFGIIDYRNDIVQKVQGLLSSVIDPVLAPLRGIIPPLAGFDISFMILWFVIEQAQSAAVSIMLGAMSYNTMYY
eukprot:TRINITY_DN31664_c0_g1_i1.p1 TRINITY_DN31664_c0_g1~~TRINITY_DN31664_c0_g1_i1.p1  ORF type:complete len:192 (+),score=36.45 TRINITY_DN31664_c0_g1_i1:23-577(+)